MSTTCRVRSISAFRATPPGQYLSRTSAGKTGWSDQPQYVSLDRLHGSEERTSYALDADLADALEQLHRQYVAQASDSGRDSRFILLANELLMASVLPLPAGA